MTDLDPRWRDAIRRHADTAEPTPEAWAAITARAETDDVVDVEVGGGGGGGGPERGRWLLGAAAAIVLIVAGAAIVAVAGDDDGAPVTAGPTTASTTTTTPAEPLIEGTAEVIDDGRDGPVLCTDIGGLDTLEASIDPPAPSCDGIPIEGWDWDDVAEERTTKGTIHGRFHLIGRFEDDRFVLQEAMDVQPGGMGLDPDDPLDDPDRFTPPCPAPFGWATRDPSRLTEEDETALMAAPRNQPDFGEIWVDESIGIPGAFGVFTATFTGDLERHRQELEAIWGGPLCVALAPITADELWFAEHHLRDLQPASGPTDIAGTPVYLGMIFSDAIGGQLVVDVVYAPPGLGEDLSELLGVPVLVTSTFQPAT